MPGVKKQSQAATRRRAAAERAAYLDRKTDGGAEGWDFFLNLARDPTADVKDRIRANEWISEHSTAGKLAQNVDVSVTDDREPEIDLSHLTLDEVRQYEALLAKAEAASARALPESTSTTVDDAEIVVEPEGEA
jgi:hypothetical protein